MFKYQSVLVFSWLLYSLALDTDTQLKEKVYYKQSASTAAVETRPNSINEAAIVLEGQPPSTSESVKLNSPKWNPTKDAGKKGNKTVPRKGAVDTSIEIIDGKANLPLNNTSEKPVVEITNASTSIPQSDKLKLVNTSKISTSTDRTSTLHVAPVKEVPQNEEKVDNLQIKTTRKPKPKPEVTIGGKEADDPIPASPTNKSPLGMPRKIDYIVPVVITITALPLLGVAFYVLYKRGRDYWDKRHYRRMDFLIDGMYNE